jgi:hypothetical protein
LNFLFQREDSNKPFAKPAVKNHFLDNQDDVKTGQAKTVSFQESN